MKVSWVPAPQQQGPGQALCEQWVLTLTPQVTNTAEVMCSLVVVSGAKLPEEMVVQPREDQLTIHQHRPAQSQYVPL